MVGPKKVKIKLRDISLVPQIQRSRRKRRQVELTAGNKPLMRITRQLTATSAVILTLKLILLATISSTPNHNQRNFFLLANCHNYKSPGSLEPREAREISAPRQHQAEDDSAPRRLERLIGLMMLNLSHEPPPLLAYERRSGMNSNAVLTRQQRLSDGREKPPATASKHLKKLLARPRQVLFSFVPQILSKQMVLKRPTGTGPGGGQVSKPSREVQLEKYRNQTASANLHMSHRHLHLGNESPGFHHPRPPSPEFLQIAKPPPLPLISIPVSRYSNVQQLPTGLEPAEEEAANDEEPSESASDGGLASEAERGLSQIDQLIKREFETRLNLNERADEWQRQQETVDNGGGESDRSRVEPNGEPADTTLSNPLIAGEPTTAQPAAESIAAREAAAPHAVFLSWPPRIHRDEPGRPAAASERDNRDEWRPTDFPPSLLTAAPLPPTVGTRKSRDSPRMSTAEIVLGRPDAMRLPPPPSQLPQSTTASANDALSAFVPSALETIAQLKLNQTSNNQQVMPSNVPIATTTTNVHKSHPLPSLDQQQQHISLLNGRPAFAGEQHNHLLPALRAGGHQFAHSQQAHIRTHPQGVNYLRNSHEPRPPGPLVNWHARDEQMSSDLRETLSRLRATKAKIRQLQAELENAAPPGLFAAETNKTITQYVDQLSTSQTSEQAKRSSQEAAAAVAAATSGRGGLEWFRSWSPPFNRTGGGPGTRPAVRAQQSMNVPLGLYYGAGPLATPARLVASALGRTVQHSVGGGPGSLAGIIGAPPGPQPTAFSLRPTKIWSSTLAIPGGDIQSPRFQEPFQQAKAADLMSVRPSSAPILLSSTLRVSTGASEQPTTKPTSLVNPVANRTMTAGSVPAGPGDDPAGTLWQDQSSHKTPSGINSPARPADVALSELRNDNRTLTSGGESDEAASEEDDNDDEPGDERPASTENNDNNGRQRPVAEGHQQRAHENTLGVDSAPVATVRPAPPTSLSAASAVDHHQRQQDEPSPSRQQHYQAPHKNGDDKRASSSSLSSFNQKPAVATESPIVIVDSPSASVHQASGGGSVLHVLASPPSPQPPPPPLVGLTTRKPGRANPGGRVPIIPASGASASESDRPLNLNLNTSTTQAFDDFTSEPTPARSVPAPVGDNFFARLIGDFGNLFRASSTANTNTSEQLMPIKIGAVELHTQSPFQVARSLNSRVIHFESGAGNQNQKQDQQQQVAVAKLTTERLARNLIVIVSALSLVSLVAVLLFVRLQQARRTRRQNFSGPHQLPAASSQSRSSGADGSDPSSLQDDLLFFDAHHHHNQQQQHRCSGWRRLGPISFISQASKGHQQAQAQQDKIILDGTMRNVSLLAKHRQPEQHRSTQPKTADDVPRPLMNRSCCHCVSCSESWLFRDSQQQQQQRRQHKLGRDTPLCSSGFYHPAPRGKLPFGAASSVNNMLQRSVSNRSQQVVRQDQQQQQQQQEVATVGQDDKQQTMGNQRAPIGGTRLRMMSAIDESGADRSSSTASDASEWQARMLLNGDCSDEFDANNCQPPMSACDCDHNHQHLQQARHYQQHPRWRNPNCCLGCSGHLLTPTEQEQQQEQPNDSGALPPSLESDGASFIVLNGNQHRFRAHNKQRRDELTSAAAAVPKDSSVRGNNEQIESAQMGKNENPSCCRARAGSNSSGRTKDKSNECHDERPMGNCGHRQTIATDEMHNCSRCCDNVSISNHHHQLAGASIAATGKKITTPNTIAAK